MIWTPLKVVRAKIKVPPPRVKIKGVVKIKAAAHCSSIPKRIPIDDSRLQRLNFIHIPLVFYSPDSESESSGVRRNFSSNI